MKTHQFKITEINNGFLVEYETTKWFFATLKDMFQYIDDVLYNENRENL